MERLICPPNRPDGEGRAHGALATASECTRGALLELLGSKDDKAGAYRRGFRRLWQRSRSCAEGDGLGQIFSG